MFRVNPPKETGKGVIVLYKVDDFLESVDIALIRSLDKILTFFNLDKPVESKLITTLLHLLFVPVKGSSGSEEGHAGCFLLNNYI